MTNTKELSSKQVNFALFWSEEYELMELMGDTQVIDAAEKTIPGLIIELKPHSLEYIWTYHGLFSSEDFNKAYPDALSALLDFLKMTLDNELC